VIRCSTMSLSGITNLTFMAISLLVAPGARAHHAPIWFDQTCKPKGRQLRSAWRRIHSGSDVDSIVLTRLTDSAIPAITHTECRTSVRSTECRHFWVDPEEEMVGVVHTQLDGSSPVFELMQLLTYQAIVD
jgi:hypothetical protein